MDLNNVEDIYQLSTTQQGMFFQGLSARKLGTYIEQIMLDLQGDLDIPAFGRAWEQVIARHPVLRTSFHLEEIDNPLQVVHRKVNLTWALFDWRNTPYEERTDRIETLTREDREAGFDLDSAPLFRMSLIRVADSDHILVWTFHHLILDGWSVSIALNEALTIYSSIQNHTNLALTPARPYIDYIKHRRQEHTDKAREFWRGELKGLVEPSLVSRQIKAQEDRGNNNEFAEGETVLSVAETHTLKSLALSRQLSLNNILHAVTL
jgi:surfactin family lipopeptide synthetase C